MLLQVVDQKDILHSLLEDVALLHGKCMSPNGQSLSLTCSHHESCRLTPQLRLPMQPASLPPDASTAAAGAASPVPQAWVCGWWW
jgi:hypothetical protein